MKNINTALFIAFYLIAFSINLIPSIKYPDANLGLLNLFTSLLFMIFLVISARKSNKTVRIFSVLGIIASVIVFLISTFEHALIGNGMLDVIASIQYPFFIVFMTPLFGGNLLIDFGYGMYAIITALFYCVTFIYSVYSKGAHHSR